MNGFTRTPFLFGAGRLVWLGPIMFGLGIAGWNRADAAAIHHNHESALVKPASYQTWSQYLMGGPSVWSTVAHPGLTQSIEASMWKNIRSDPPPDTTPLVNYFLYKQSLDPARFDHYHPQIAKALAKIEAQLLNPATTTSPTNQAQQLTPSSTPSTVPEPATFILAIGMTGYALWWRRRHI